MSITLPERRRIAVVSGEHRVDLAVPLDETLGEVLRSVGIALEPGRHVVLERTGAEARLGTPGSELVEGAMYSVIDLRTRLDGDKRAIAANAVRDSGALWWMLAAVAIVAIGVQALQPASVGQDATPQRLLASGALGFAAVASALVWARRHPVDSTLDAVSMLSPLLLAFAAGFVAIPPTLAAAAHLAVLSGLLMATVLSALLTATVGGLRLRSSVGVATIIFLSLSVVWGLTLLLGADVAAAAAISAGAVPLALRVLPSTLLAVDEGYHIDYEKHMSSRWTVRGNVPSEKTDIREATVREVVEESSARLLAGTALLSVVPVAMIPIALTTQPSNGLILGGTIGLLATVVIALLLISRHTASAPLRWIPRGAAIVILITSIAAATFTFGPLVLTIAAAAFLGAGILAAAVLVPISRGARSLVWSRLADVFEALAVALSLPAAFLAADVLSLLRGMMAA